MATSIQNPSNTNIIVNEWTNVYSAGPVAGFTGTVRIVVEVGSGTTIKLANSSTGVNPITQGYGNLYNGSATSIAFEGTQDEVNAALQSLQAFNSNAAGSGTLRISAVKAGSAYNPDNGHYYQAIYSSGGIGWLDAKAAAASAPLKFNGLQGYLATITSAKENEFILNKLPADAWIGATDKDVEGRWKWDTGPEAGQEFWYWNGSTGVTVSGRYHNWNSNEPNNSSSHTGSPEGEDYGQFYVSGGSPGKWNDLPGAGATAGKLKYYVVEYGGMGSDAPTEAAASSSSTLTVQARPVITSNGGGTTATINYAENGTAAVTTVTASDDDSGDSKTYSIAGGADANSFNINSDNGVLTFKTSPNFEAPTDSDTNNSYQVTVRVTDGVVNGQTRYDEQTLTINVTNVNEAVSFTSAPVTLAVADTGVVDTFTPLTGALTASDIDGDAPIFTIQGGTTASGFSTKTDAYGLLTLNTSTGAYSYTPDAAKVNALAAGTNPVSSFIIELSDGKGSNASQYLKVNLTGANDQPVLQADDNTSAATQASTLVNLPAISEDTSTQGQTVANLLGSRVTDPDADSSLGGMLVTANAAPAEQGKWQYKVSGGSWKDVPAGLTDTNALALAASTSLRFVPAADYHGEPGKLTVHATDNVFTGYTNNTTPAYANISADGVSLGSKAVGITVTPVNDAPVITSGGGAAILNAATLSETAGYDNSATLVVTDPVGSLTGSLTAKDVDGAETLSYSIRGGIAGTNNVTKDGNYGALTLTKTGDVWSWTYAVDNKVGLNALLKDASVTETFTLQVYDEVGATRSQDVVITLQGTNDTPVLIAGGLADQSFTVGQNFKLQLPAHSFTDAEGLNLAYTATLENGDALPAWLTFDEGARTFSGSAVPGAPASLNIKVTASDGSAAVSDIFKLDLVANTVTSGANTPANAAPTTTNDHLSTTGTASVALTVNDFGNYSDVNGDALAFVKIVTPPTGAAGTLKLNGLAVSANQEVAVADITGGKLTFEPGTSAAAITFQVGDGTAFSSTRTLAIDVANATSDVTLDASSVTTAQANTWTSVYSGNTEVLTGYDGTVRVTVGATGGNIKLTNDTGVVAAAGSGNLTDGSATSITFEGSLAAVNSALQQLQGNLATNPAMTLTVSAINGGVVSFNGHDYRHVSGATWDAALTAAASSTYNGQQGYLAAVTTTEEQAFLQTNFVGKSGWIGASDSAEEGSWKWVTGPESGILFWTGAAAGTANVIDSSTLYNNWDSDEPSGGELEDAAYLDFSQESQGYKWIDAPASASVGYYIEYGGLLAAPATLTDQATRTITLTKPDTAPVLSVAGVAAYTENAVPKALNPALALTDADNTTLASATVTISAGQVTGDVLAFTNDNAATFGNIAVTQYDAATGVLTLNSSGSSATLAQWEAALKAVTFASSSDAPGTSRTLQWQVNDGSNASNVGTTSITVTPVNDAPVASLPDVTVPAATDWSLSIADAFTDPDGAGTVTYSAAYWSGTEWTALPAVAGDGYWLGFAPGTKTFSGNPPANLPALNIQVTGSDGTASTTSSFTLNLADATRYAFAANNPGAVTVSGPASPKQGETLTADTPTDADGVTPATVSYQWQVSSDNGSTWLDVDGARGKAAALTLAQTESGKKVQVLAFYTDKAGVAEMAKSTALDVTDVEDAGVVTFTAAPLNNDETITALLSDADGLTNATPTYQWYRSTDGNSWTAITGATQAAYTIVNADGGNFLRAGVSYTDDRGHASTAFGATGNKVTLGAIKPVAVNDTGTVAEAGGTGNATPAPAPSTGNVLGNDTDANGDTLSVTALRTGGTEGVGTVATETDGGTTLTLAGSYGTLVLTKASGAYSYTLNQTHAAVEALQADQSLIESFNYTVTDPTSKSDIGVLSITINGADDALVVSNLPATFTVTEDVAMAIDFGNSFNLSDPDLPGDTTVTLEASEGTLSGQSAPGVTVSGSGTGTLTLMGTLGNISTWLKTIGSLQYTSALNDSGTPGATLRLKSGVTTLETANINITPVNDAPVISSNGGDAPTPIDYEENGTAAVTTVQVTDPDSGDTPTFSISGGDDADLFRIDALTGALTFRNSPNFEIPADANNDNTYIVTVKVADAAGLTDEQTLTVNVTDDDSANDPIETGGAGSQTITAPANNAKINVTGSGTTTITNPAGNLTIANSGSGTVVVEGLNPGATINTSGTGATQISDPEGSLTVVNSGTGTVTVDGLNTDSVLSTTGSGPTAVTNPDGNLSVANSGTGTVTVSGLNAGASLSASGSGPTQVSDPEGSLTVVNSGSGVVTVDGLNTGSVLTTTGSGPTAVTNPDGNLEVANNGAGTVTVNGLNPGASLTASGTGTTQVNDPEGSLSINNSGSGTVTVDGLNAGSVLTTTGSGPTAVANPDGNLSVANNGTGTVTVNGLNPNASLSASGSGPTLIENPDASLIVANSGTGTVTVNGLNTGGVLTTTGSGPTAVTNPDGNLAVANNGTGTVTVNGLNPNASLTANGTGPTLVNDPEGNLTVSNSGSGTVTVAGLNDGAVLNSNGTGPVRVTDPDDDVSVVNNGSGTVSVDGMKAGAVLSSSGTGPVTITKPDGNLRVANTGTGTVTVEDLKPGATLTATGTKPVNVDLSHLSSGQTITIDNDGSGVVNLVNVPEGVTVLTTGSSGSGDINYVPTLSGVPGTTQGVTAGSAAALADFTVADRDSGNTLTVTLTATNGSIGGLTDEDTNTPGIQLTGTAAAINTALAGATFTAASAGAASITISVTDGVVSSPTTATYSLNAVPAPSSGSAPTPAPSPEGAIQNGVSNTTVTTDGGAQTTTTGTIGTVPVVETVTVTADGNTVRELVYVPTTTGTGAGSSTPTVLPLLYESVAGSTSNTTVSLPSGVGLVSVGDRTPTTTTGQQGLITLIQSTVSDGDPSRTDMLGGGQSFLDTLPQDATLWVNKIQLTAPTALPNAPSVPVVVSGAARTEASTSTADKLEALVIDATALPQGTVIELHDIDFAVVVGNGVFVRGGSGANVVYGGAGSQYILLGEADDVLYGGADDDTVGSEGGNDRIFGNAGNDTLFGGEGEDLLHGGADTDVATFTGSISRYEIVRDHGKTIVRALDRADDVDTVINVETLRFDDADYTVENAPQYTVIASLYGEVLDRQADLAGFQYWAERYAAGESMGDIALSFLYSAEYQSGSGLQFSALSTAAQLDLFYLHFLGRTPDEAGHAYWMNRIEDGMSLNDVAHSFVVSTEMQGVYAQPTAWEFLL